MSIMETMARGGCAILPVLEDSGTCFSLLSGTMGASWLREWHLERRPASEAIVECLCSDEDLPPPETEASVMAGRLTMHGGQPTEIPSGIGLAH